MAEPAQPPDDLDDENGPAATGVVLEGVPPGSLGAGAEEALAWALHRLEAQLPYAIVFVCQLSDGPRAVQLAANRLVATDVDPAIDRCREWLTAIGNPTSDPGADRNLAQDLPTRSCSHVGVPLLFSDGSLYGMFTRTGPPGGGQIGEEQLHLVRAVASATADRIEQAEQDRHEHQRRS